jgi:hypothetical protein
MLLHMPVFRLAGVGLCGALHAHVLQAVAARGR